MTIFRDLGTAPKIILAPPAVENITFPAPDASIFFTRRGPLNSRPPPHLSAAPPAPQLAAARCACRGLNLPFAAASAGHGWNWPLDTARRGRHRPLGSTRPELGGRRRPQSSPRAELVVACTTRRCPLRSPAPQIAALSTCHRHCSLLALCSPCVLILPPPLLPAHPLHIVGTTRCRESTLTGLDLVIQGRLCIGLEFYLGDCEAVDSFKS